MSDLPPLLSWVAPEFEEKYRAWQAQLDDYIQPVVSKEKWRLLEAKGYKWQEGGKRQPKQYVALHC